MNIEDAESITASVRASVAASDGERMTTVRASLSDVITSAKAEIAALEAIDWDGAARLERVLRDPGWKRTPFGQSMLMLTAWIGEAQSLRANGELLRRLVDEIGSATVESVARSTAGGPAAWASTKRLTMEPLSGSATAARACIGRTEDALATTLAAATQAGVITPAPLAAAPTPSPSPTAWGTSYATSSTREDA